MSTVLDCHTPRCRSVLPVDPERSFVEQLIEGGWEVDGHRQHCPRCRRPITGPSR